MFGFADKKNNFCIGLHSYFKRNNNNDPIIRTAAVDADEVVVKDISGYVPHYVPNLKNQQLVLNQISNKGPTELSFTERTVFRKDVNTNNNWTFEIGNSGESTPTFVIVGLQARNKIGSQTHDNATFDRSSFSNAVCKIVSEKYPDDGIECDYDRDKNDQAYSEIENFYQLKNKTNLFNPFIDLHKFRRSCKFYVFDPNKKSTLLLNQ